MFSTKYPDVEKPTNRYLVKPWMSNKNFLNGLFWSINRSDFAETRGAIPSYNYFADAYLDDPIAGHSYNASEAHELAERGFDPSLPNSNYGFNQAKATAYFADAVDELVASGDITLGTTINKTKIYIDIWWMYQNDETTYGEDIANYFTDAFNNSEVGKGCVELEVRHNAESQWEQVYNDHLMVGVYDLGFGAISGNTLNPLNFMEVLKSDNSSGFTLNWGPDTSKIDLSYNGEMWSFDNLWAAADHGVVTYKGESLPPIVVTFGKSEFDGDGNLAVTFSYQTAKSYMKEKAESDPEAAKLAALDNELFACELKSVYITDGHTAELKFGFDDEGKGVAFDDYKGAGYIKDFAFAQGSNSQKGTVTITLTADALASFANDGAEGVFYFGAYGLAAVDGVASEGDAYGSVYYYDSSVVNE